jgi:hypothetical protein
MSVNWKCVPGEPTDAMYEAADLAADLDELPRLSRDELRCSGRPCTTRRASRRTEQ